LTNSSALHAVLAATAWVISSRSIASHAVSGEAGFLMRSWTVRTPAASTWRRRAALSTMA
jgi:hypothetical protein